MVGMSLKMGRGVRYEEKGLLLRTREAGVAN